MPRTEPRCSCPEARALREALEFAVAWEMICDRPPPPWLALARSVLALEEFPDA